MIQYWMKDQMQPLMNGVRLTVDFEPDADNYGTVFYEGGGAPDRHDFNIRRPNYMVWIQSTDWGQAELLAQEAFDLFHAYHKRFPDTEIAVEFYKANQLIKTEHYILKSMFAVGDPNPLGVDNGKMQYSVNVETMLIKKGES